MKMTKIDKIWTGLESVDAQNVNLIYKRYSTKIVPDIFVALKVAVKLRCIAFKIGVDLLINENDWIKFKDIKIETVSDAMDQKKKFLLILLLNKQHKDIFSTLCEDLIQGVSDIDSDEILAIKLKDRLLKWQTLFEKVGREGLSEESQRGLFGEVYFLRLLLNNKVNKMYCLKSWLGPENAIQDFQHSDWAVEVKTTHGNNHQKIFISSERQLDNKLVDKIFLYHLSLEVRVGRGETLNAIIDAVTDLLSENLGELNLFKLKLLESGYYDAHQQFYEEKGYTIRQENIYRVAGNFPRLTESQIPVGVGDVKYSIVLSESEDWRTTPQVLFGVI